MKEQRRGNCQCCGRDQAVLASGLMAKHGYQVTNGWFQGVCTGRSYSPMQIDRGQTDEIVATVRKDVAVLARKADGLKSGKLVPNEAKSAPWPKAPMVPFAEAAEYFQEEAVRMAIYTVESRIRHGNQFADDMTLLADLHYGEPLRVVAAAVAPEPVRWGDKRLTVKGNVIVAEYVDRAAVRYKDPRGFIRTMSTRAWRLLAAA